MDLFQSSSRSRLDSGGGRLAVSNCNNDAPPVNRGNAAMNLYDKFNALLRDIDNTRDEQRQTRLKIDAIQQAVNRTRQERDSMKREIVNAKKEANITANEIDEENQSLFEMEGERGQALMEKQQGQRELDQVKAFVYDQRRQFLLQSKNFRANCKRVRLRSSVLGLEYAPLKAFATVMAGETEEASRGNKKSPRSVVLSPSHFAEAQQQTRVYRPATSKGEEKDADPSSDPRNWKPDPRDEAMKQSLQAYAKELERQQEAKQSLEELKSKDKKASDQGKDRSQRKQQLLAQLDRIKKDCQGIESDIAQIQKQTVETKQLGRAFEKDVKVKRQELAQRRFEAGITGNQNPPRNQRPSGGGVVRSANPYARRNNNSNNNSHQMHAQLGGGSERSANRRNNNIRNNSSSRTANNRAPPPSSYSQQQHPHRVGRVRVDKQFASTVSITAPAAASNWSQRTRHILDDSDDSDDDLFALKKRT